MNSTSHLSTSYNVRSASKYLDEPAQSAHWTVYSMARSKAELKVQLCFNAMFYVGIFCITIGVGFVGTGILDIVSTNVSMNYGVSLWAGALFALLLGAMLLWFRSDDEPSKCRVNILLAISCSALIMHFLVVALSAVAVSNEYLSFNNKLVNACDPDPNSYYVGSQTSSSGANYNPNNPNYIKDCSPNNTFCNTNNDQYATANPAYWWSTNKDTVFKVYTYYRTVFRFAYCCDVCEMVMAIQAIAAEIAMIIAFKYLSNHLDELDVDETVNYTSAANQTQVQVSAPAPVDHQQKVISYLNASTPQTAPPPPQSAPPARNQHTPDETGNGEQPIYANVHGASNGKEPTYDNLKKPAEPVAPAAPPPVAAPAAAPVNTSRTPNGNGSRSTLNTVSGSAAGLSLASRSSRPPRGAVQTRAMLAEEAPPQTLPLKRLNNPTTSSKTALTSAAPPPVRVGASSSRNQSALPSRHAPTKY